MTCQKCGAAIETHGSPDDPIFHPINFCSMCRHPLTEKARRAVEGEEAEAAAALDAATAGGIISAGAEVVGIAPRAARAIILRWAQREP